MGFKKDTRSLACTLLGAVMLLGECQVLAETWSADRPAWANTQQRSTANKRASQDRLSDDERDIAPFSPGSNNLALEFGQVFLMGELSDEYSDNIGSQLHYTYGVSEIFGFDSSLGYSSHSDGKFSMTTFLAGLRTNLTWYDRVVPYAAFGLGFYKPSYKFGPKTTVSPVLFGLHLGPGVDLQVSKQLFFGTALTFHDIFGTNKETPVGPRELGGTYTSFLLHAGLTF